MAQEQETTCKCLIIYNSIIPFKGYLAINLFGIIFARRILTDVEINHEKIHTAQMKELLYIGFYLWYILEYIFNIFKYKGNLDKAYMNISFEKEAYFHQKDLDYLENRKHYVQWRS